MERAETAAWLRLAFAARLPAPLVAATARRWLGSGRPLAALFEASAAELACLELTPLRLNNLRAAPAVEPRLLQDLAERDIALLPCTAASYPISLTRAAGFDPPPLLLWKGCRAALERPMAAIVGSREPSGAALTWAQKLAGWLARARVNVVSGNARGIDQAAHAGAAQRGGLTTAVLPEGLLQFGGNLDLALALSAVHPSAPVAPRHALARNGIIAALSTCLVVAEARTRGGTWNAANQALAQGRPVLVRPADPDSGNAALLRRGAVLLPAEPLRASDVVMRYLEHAPAPPAAEPVLPGF